MISKSVVDRHAGAAADVIGNPERSLVARRHSCCDRVGHEREVARLLAVAVERDGVAPERGPNELVERHVRPLPRAVHREVPHRRRRDPMVRVVQVAQLLGRELRDAVRRHRLGERILPHGDADVVAVDRRARGVDEPVQRPADAGLEQPLRRVDVVVRVDPEVGSPALADAGLRREMKHMRLAVEQCREVSRLEASLRRSENPSAPRSRRDSIP